MDNKNIQQKYILEYIIINISDIFREILRKSDMIPNNKKILKLDDIRVILVNYNKLYMCTENTLNYILKYVFLKCNLQKKKRQLFMKIVERIAEKDYINAIQNINRLNDKTNNISDKYFLVGDWLYVMPKSYQPSGSLNISKIYEYINKN